MLIVRQVFLASFGYHNQRASAKNVFFSSISREDGLPHNDLPDLAAVVASHS